MLALIDTVFNGRAVEDMFSDGRKPKKNPLNDNFHRKEFQELWRRINRKAVYQVEFDTAALVRSCINRLERDLKVTPLQYLVTEGALEDAVTDDRLRAGRPSSKARFGPRRARARILECPMMSLWRLPKTQT